MIFSGGVRVEVSSLEEAAKIPPYYLARSMGRVARFTGNTEEPNMVLQHVIAGARYALSRWNDGGRLALLFLTHDAPEAISGEVPRGFKTDDHSKLEDRILEIMHGAWQIPMADEEEYRALKWLDRAICQDEAHEYDLQGYPKPPSGDVMLRRFVHEVKETMPFTQTATNKTIWSIYHEIIVSKNPALLDLLSPGKAI